jgi:hypothetical protein
MKDATFHANNASGRTYPIPPPPPPPPASLSASSSVSSRKVELKKSSFSFLKDAKFDAKAPHQVIGRII